MIPTMLTTREEGMLEGQRKAIRVVLEQRFGPLSETARQRLEACSGERLDELLLALLDAQSLKELGLED